MEIPPRVLRQAQDLAGMTGFGSWSKLVLVWETSSRPTLQNILIRRVLGLRSNINAFIALMKNANKRVGEMLCF